MVEIIPSNVEIKTFQLKEKDYIWQIFGKFKQGVLNSITFKSKLGREQTFEDDNSPNAGESFNFSSKPNEIPSCFYGATITTPGETKICYIGFEFTDEG